MFGSAPRLRPGDFFCKPMKDPIEVAAGLVFCGGKLLITQRPVGRHLAGLWEFPGGKIISGETAQETQSRELAEELGIEVTTSSSFM